MNFTNLRVDESHELTNCTNFTNLRVDESHELTNCTNFTNLRVDKFMCGFIFVNM